MPTLIHHNFTDLLNSKPPKELGYHFPAEFEKHEATWLTWPHKEASWPGKMNTIYKPYVEFIKLLTQGEKVRINVNDEQSKAFAISHLQKADADLSQIEFYFNPSNDAWCRDHGPAFLVNPTAEHKKVIVDWDYNAWG
ncbi:MAG: agmatine deiminase family protein, partial [Daejeonella sp.]